MINSSALKILLLATVLNAGRVFGQSFPVIEVFKKDKLIILIGSNHAGRSPVYSNESFDREISRSKAICFEYDDSDKEAVAKTGQIVSGNLGGRSLDKRFNEETIKRIKDRFSPYVKDPKDIYGLTPFMLYVLLEKMEKRINHMNSKLKEIYSIDKYIKNIALKNGVTRKGLEDRYAVANAISEISDSEWQEFLNRFMSMLDCDECVDRYVQNMETAYTSSKDPNHVYEYLMKSFYSDPKLWTLYEKFLLTERNKSIAEKIDIELFDHGKCDVAVIGAAHLGGENGVLAELKKRGMNIKNR
ncbi:TraB/GumN family protein [Undibacterium umbellatum]|uniref:TraB/GumN family protein n=1 Tax=Undibacterium umbellatum TaxID=2762300 RepID=A0ABR6ZAL4_9BURK|nr:TraB/GumN family protein [Undibacterium umbellatum]MBC3908796.1 TraB/GumN family protein [Undibacterium umbellatum]